MRAVLTQWMSGALLAALLAGCGTQGAGAGLFATGGLKASNLDIQATRFKLATYNVENLFDGQTVPLDGKLRKAKPEAAKQALAKTLHELDADVLGLAEVESEPTLKTFRDQYLADMGYKHIALVEGNDGRGIDVAIMSRHPISAVKSHKHVRFSVSGQPGRVKFSRDLLQATIKPTNGYQFTLFVAHLKSHLGGDAADQKRQAEAEQVNRILQDFEREKPRTNYALVGDLNDPVEAGPLKTLLNPNKKLAKLFDSLLELGAGAYTYHPIEYRSRIDHILLSRGMAAEYVKGSAKIHASATSEAASDHYPASVTIEAWNRGW